MIQKPPSHNWDAELYEARHSFVWRFGKGLIEMLNPQPGERILDIGCGTGHLTSDIAQSGAHVIGLDSSADMVGQARQNFPKLSFVLQNVTDMQYQSDFDAIFSNAVLHWVLESELAAEAMSRALKTGGRFVAEFGGHGNVQTIESTIRVVVASYLGEKPLPASRTHYPTIAEYSSILDRSGFEVRMAELYERPTPLEGDSGMENWIRQFKWYYFEQLPAGVREQALAEVIQQLHPKLNNAKGWFADYRRLRIQAVKV